MNIFYTDQGMPVIIIDDIAYVFNVANKTEVLSQLSMNPEYIPEILDKVVEYLETIKWENFSSGEDVYSNIRSFLRYISDAHTINHVVNTVEDAYKTSIMLSTPQPYDSWLWDGVNEQWVPPVSYPENAPKDVYMWDESEISWVPVEQKPHASWEWSRANLRYEAPVAYPIDAKDGQFIWNESTRSWILNDQMG